MILFVAFYGWEQILDPYIETSSPYFQGSGTEVHKPQMFSNLYAGSTNVSIHKWEEEYVVIT